MPYIDAPLGSPSTRRPAGRGGFTIVEIIVVVVIITALMAILLGAVSQWDKKARINQTIMTLRVLDSVIDEYHEQTGNWFSASVVNIGDFFLEVNKVGEIPKILAPLSNPTWQTGSPMFLDGFGTTSSGATGASLNGQYLAFRNPHANISSAPGATATGPISGKDRPWFWSFGPNLTNDSGDDCLTVAGDDIKSAGGSAP